MSLKSISVDETPETEVHKVEKESEVLSDSSSQVEGKSRSIGQAGSLLLSPPDISTASASPGEETDHTVTEASSTTVTPSQSIVELPDRLSPQLESDPVQLRANAQLHGSRSQRASCPTAATESSTGLPVQRTCRRSVPEPLKGESEPGHDWLKVGESIQLRPSNQSGVVAYLGPTQFAAGLWVGVELDTVLSPSQLISSAGVSE